MKNIIFFCLFLILATYCFPQELRIESGTQFVFSGAPHLVLENSQLTQNGTFIPDQSTLTLTGDATPPSSSLGGSGSLPLYRLVINKSNHHAQLDTDVQLAEQLLFQAGNLDLQGHELDLGTTGYLTNEQENQRLISSLPSGEVVRQVSYTAPTMADSGNLGLQLTSTANLGNTTIRRGHFPATLPGGSGIERYVDIRPNLNTGLNATLRLSYFDQELNGLPETDLLLFRSEDAGANWNPAGFSSKDANNNYVEQTGIDGFSVWTAATFATFPLDWLSFTAEAQGEQVLCQWETASERDLSHYEVQRSRDGMTFHSFAQLAATGSPQSSQSYTAIDPHPFEGQNVYRVKALHEDGMFLYSPPVAIWFHAHTAISVYPTPTQDQLWVSLSMPQASDVRISLFDMRGRQLMKLAKSVGEGHTEIPLSLASLPSGMYSLDIHHPMGSYRHKILKQ
ncbi:MAG: T9SS type A sorting domain-containing protein [Bacteroidota bacterium]